MLYWQEDALIIGGVAGLFFFVLLTIKYRFRCYRRLSWPQIFLAAGVGGLALYHIIWVIWGRGRVGWP